MVEKEVEECMEYILKKVQKREINRRYSAKHKEKISIKDKMQYKKDPDKFRKRCKAWRDNNRDKKRAIDKKYSRSDKGVVCSRKKNKKRYDKDMGTVEGKRKWDIDRMHSSIKKRCENHYGLIGKTKYHIEGYGWVHPPINGDETWRWDGVTRKN
tara:strand:+ start:164 stop:628 length:465 start_codon:yes stop_codon:yes gene_type:complete